MDRIKTEEALNLLSSEIQKVSESAQKTDEASKDKLSGFSAAGDKYHAKNASDLVKSYLQRLELLKKELTDAVSQISETAEPPCCLEMVYDDGQTARFYLVKNAVSLPNLSFISPDSPIGKAVLGKKAGETFSYKLESGHACSGRIISLK